MSSSVSLSSELATSTTILHAPSHRSSYNNIHEQRQFHHHFCCQPPSPHSITATRPLALAHLKSTDVIAARPTSCMQLNFAPAKAVFVPQHAWKAETTSADWRVPAEQTSRSVQEAYPPNCAPWSMQSTGFDNSGMGFVGLSALDGLKEHHSHQRASSTSTIASNGPTSPYNFTSSNPHIANTDTAPFDYSVDSAKEYLPSQQTATNPAFLSASYLRQHLARSNSQQRYYDFAPTYAQYPMSNSADHPSHDTLSSGVEEAGSVSQGTKLANGGNARRVVPSSQPADFVNRALEPHVQLSRTESAAYQDELYNPANFTSAPMPVAKPTRPQVSTPAPRTLVNQYLESANMARSASPRSAVSRERSPYREGSELALSEAWSSPSNPIQTAAGRRQQMKLEREEAEMAAHRPQLQREPTKTISPKDALLDYNEDQPPLLQDLVPVGYKQHLGGTEPYTDSTTSSSSTALKNATFNHPTTNLQTNMPGFRASSGDAYATAPNFNFSPPVSQTATTMQNPFQMGAYQHLAHLDPAYAAVSLAESTPHFPATLTSMESSISDHTAALSSQESNMTGISRPADTRANAGAYTCTFHGCAQRFDSPALLQRHKRELHRFEQQQQQQHQQQNSDHLSVEASESPRSTASPGPAGSGLTSAQILARNSQTGPHKCTRTNPSTGKPCNTIFSRPYDLTRHEETIHNGRKHKVRCPYCREEKTFSRNDALTRHMRVVHPDIENFGKRGRRGD